MNDILNSKYIVFKIDTYNFFMIMYNFLWSWVTDIYCLSLEW